MPKTFAFTSTKTWRRNRCWFAAWKCWPDSTKRILRRRRSPSGQTVPDFTLTDQTGQRVSLSRFAGKVVGVTFIYTSCPLPDFCFRLSNNFERLQKRFATKMGSDLVLLSISFDPVHDTPEVLAKYASTWKADPNSWHFLTGTPAEVKPVCRRFGLNFWPDEGSLAHSLHTLVIDREGKLAANFEGNQFSAEQLGDFVDATLNHVRKLSDRSFGMTYFWF